MLIASEVMPVSLPIPIAANLGATQGLAGQAVSISGLLAVATSLFIATIAGRFDRRYVLIVLTAAMLASLLLIVGASNFGVLMAARALLDVTIGGTFLLVLASLIVGNGDRIRRPSPAERAPVNVGAGQPCCELGH
jgi:predicted MFS family arabinose efflux permease